MPPRVGVSPAVQAARHLPAAVVGPSAEWNVPESDLRPGGWRELRLQLLWPDGELRRRECASDPVAWPRPLVGRQRHGERAGSGFGVPGPDQPVRSSAGQGRLVGRTRLQGLLDLYNVFNSNVALRLNGAYGSNGVGWAAPQAIVPGRLVKFGMQLRF